MARNQYIYSNDNKKGVGVNGIRGDRFESVPGWEHGTVGFAGNVYSACRSCDNCKPRTFQSWTILAESIENCSILR